MSYKLIVTDMDGTLLGSDHQITSENKKALIKLLDKGINVAIATGRWYDSAKLHTEFLQRRIPIIACNGALIKYEDKVIYSNYMDNNVCISIIDILEKHNIYYQCYGDKALYCKKMNTINKRFQELHDKMKKEMKLIFDTDLKEYVKNNNILKMIVFEDTNKELLKILKQELKNIIGIEITSSGPDNLEIMNEGVNKGKAVSILCDYLNINKDETMAFGDSYNDLSMLEYVGMGIAMDNADDYIKSRANITTDTNDNDGVAKAIYKFIEI